MSLFLSVDIGHADAEIGSRPRRWLASRTPRHAHPCCACCGAGKSQAWPPRPHLVNWSTKLVLLTLSEASARDAWLAAHPLYNSAPAWAACSDIHCRLFLALCGTPAIILSSADAPEPSKLVLLHVLITDLDLMGAAPRPPGNIGCFMWGSTLMCYRPISLKNAPV